MKTCKMIKCDVKFEPRAPHQEFHSEKCRFKHHQIERQKLVKFALKHKKKI